jgi:hypothetical protein
MFYKYSVHPQDHTYIGVDDLSPPHFTTAHPNFTTPLNTPNRSLVDSKANNALREMGQVRLGLRTVAQRGNEALELRVELRFEIPAANKAKTVLHDPESASWS